MPVHAHALVQGDVKQAEGAGITGQLEVVGAERLPALVVPHESGDVAGEPEPAETFLRGDVVAAEGARRPLEHRGRCGVPLGDQHGQAVPEEIRRSRWLRRRWHGPRRLGDFQHTAAVGQTTDDDRGPQRVEVGLACERGVERLEPLGGLEQQRGRVAAASHREGDLRAEEVHAGAVEFVERSGLRRGQQSEGRVGRAGVVRGLRRGQRALRAARRLGRQFGRALQEGGGRRQAPARLRPVGRALQLARDVFVAARRRVRAVPGAAIGIDVRIGRLRQHPVRALAILRGCRLVDRRAHERMAKPHPRADLEQTRLGRRRRGLGSEPEPLCGPPQHRRVADGLGRRDQQQLLRLRREHLEAPAEALLDMTCQGSRGWMCESARRLIRCQPQRQLEQRERISARLGDDAVAHLLVQRHPDDRGQQRPRIILTKTFDHQLREPGRVALLGARADSEDDADRLRQQAARHERQRLRRGTIQPLRIIDQADQRAFLGHLGQQAQDGQADEKAIGRVPGGQAERGAQRIALRTREPFEPIEHRRAQLMQPGERELHLGLDARSASHATPHRMLGDVLQQRCLAHTCVPADCERPALSRPNRLEQPVERRGLAAPAEQPSVRGYRWPWFCNRYTVFPSLSTKICPRPPLLATPPPTVFAGLSPALPAAGRAAALPRAR